MSKKSKDLNNAKNPIMYVADEASITGEPIRVAERILHGEQEEKKVTGELEEECARYAERHCGPEEMGVLDIRIFREIGRVDITPETVVHTKFRRTDKK